MALKTVVFSDISNLELSEDQHARAVIKHPDIPSALELDISADEAAKFQSTTLRLATVRIYEPNKPPREVQIETKVLDRLFEGVNFDEVLAGARKADQPRTAPSNKAAWPRKRPAAGSSTAERTDYSTPEHAGKLHRGRITDAEKQWVRKNKAAASKNREVQTGKPINFDDEAEKRRYGL